MVRNVGCFSLLWKQKKKTLYIYNTLVVVVRVKVKFVFLKLVYHMGSIC